MDQLKNTQKELQKSAEELNSYKSVLRGVLLDASLLCKDKAYKSVLLDASLLFEDKITELSLLRRFGNILGYIPDQELFYKKFVDILIEETNAENCSLMVMDKETNSLVLKVARGRLDESSFFDHAKDSKITFELGEGVAGKAALEKESILINNVNNDKRFTERATRFPISSLLCVPLIFQEKVLGVINISHTQPDAFSQNSRRALEILCIFASPVIGNAIEQIKLKDQEKFKAMFEGVRLSIMLIDPETSRIVDCNKYTEEWLGYSRKDLISLEQVFDLVHHGYRKKAKQILKKTLTKDNPEFTEISFINKDSKTKIGEINSTMIGYQGEKIVQITIRDITERKEIENQLLQSEKLKSLGELAGGVAHDFNNVLAIILGRAQLLKINIGPPPDKGERRKSIVELKKGMETIERAALDGAETVRRIQEFARKRDDDKYFTSVDINKVIDDALEFTKLNWKNGAESKGIKINIKKELSALTSVAGSASELREVLTNLINNAIFAMPQGGTITVKTVKKGSYACIKVQDTGMGIPKAIRDRIFDPFFTTKGPQSSGLGMSVSYGIIERHRGTISVDSVDGKGTTFTVEIPFSEKPVEKGKVVPISSGQKKVNILIVEDEEDVRNVLQDILTHEGHSVETAANGKLGIEKFKKNNFDVVLTDLGMPGMTGWQVAEKIKAINGKVPVALITGWSIDLNESEMKEKGIDFIIKKPYTLDQLVNVVEGAMILRDQHKAV